MTLGGFVGMVGMSFRWSFFHTYMVATAVAVLTVFFLGRLPK